MYRRSKIKFQPNIKVSNRQKERVAENQDTTKNGNKVSETIIKPTFIHQTEVTTISPTINKAEKVTKNFEPIIDEPCTTKPNEEASPCKMVNKLTQESKQIDSKPKKKIKISSKGIIDKSQVTLHDFLYFNPPMAEKKKKKKKITVIKELENNYDCDTEVEEDLDDKSIESIGPRVKIGPNGQLILDEESLVIKKKPLLNDTVIEETYLSRATYSSFKKNPSRNSRWTPEETLEFYTALNLVGPDFSLMADLFFNQKRSRTDLKNKFRRESKANKLAIDKALYEGEYEYCLAEDSSIHDSIV